MTEFISSEFLESDNTSTIGKAWTTVTVGRSNRSRNKLSSKATKQDTPASSRAPPQSADSNRQDAKIWEQPKDALHWGTASVDLSTNPWATEPAPADVNWGDMEHKLMDAFQEEWVYQDPDAPLELTSLNLAAYCSPIACDWNQRIKNAQQFHEYIKQERITKWVMEATEEDAPNLRVKGVRPLWKPFSNRSPHILPGAYS